MDAGRRRFFGIGGVALAGTAITWPTSRNRREKYQDEILYRGSIRVPEIVLTHALQGRFYRTTSRHEAIRFKLHGVTFLFRELSPTEVYAGEIVRTQGGQIRVHLWRIIERENARLDLALIYPFGDSIDTDLLRTIV